MMRKYWKCGCLLQKTSVAKKIKKSTFGNSSKNYIDLFNYKKNIFSKLQLGWTL